MGQQKVLKQHHSLLMGGSNAERRINCEASYVLEESSPTMLSEDFTADGVALHEVMQDMLLAEDTPSPYTYLGRVFNKVVITRDMIDNKIIPAYESFIEISETNGGLESYIIEVRVDYGELMPDAYGYTDLLGKFKNGKMLCLDWKFGEGDKVSASENSQLAFYTGAAMYTDIESIVNYMPPEAFDIVFAVIQPRERDVEYAAPIYDVWDTNDNWVEDFIGKAIDAYKRSQSLKAKYEHRIQLVDVSMVNAGDHCRYCRASSFNCPINKELVEDVESFDLGNVEPDDIADALDLVSKVKKWIKTVEKTATDALKSDTEIPRYAMVPTRGTRQYINKPEAERILKRYLGAGRAFKPKALIAPGEAKKLLGSKRYAKLLDKHVATVSKNVTIGPSDTYDVSTD